MKVYDRVTVTVARPRDQASGKDTISLYWLLRLLLNTGGQSSKLGPVGATLFKAGKRVRKKDHV